MQYSWENSLIPSDSCSQAIIDAVSATLHITSADTHVLNENLLSSKWVLPPFPAVVEDSYYTDAVTTPTLLSQGRSTGRRARPLAKSPYWRPVLRNIYYSRILI